MPRAGIWSAVLLLALAGAPARAGDTLAALASHATVASNEPLILAAAPRESAEAGQRLYAPLAALLSQATGRPVVYYHPGSWGVYRTEMLRGRYDLVLDGPHFNSWRAERLGHEILVKLPGVHQFAIIARQDTLFAGLQRLAGRSFCTLAPPNLGALVLLDLFDNPARQPLIVPVQSWRAVYDGVVAGRCVAGVLPIAQLRDYDRTQATRILYYSDEMPGQALSAGPRVGAAERVQIRQALLSVAGTAASTALRASHQIDASFVAARNQDYAGLARYLRDEWGFY
jgi:ABC-type phosphate/phosphonate transport system substrate-binding protein